MFNLRSWGDFDILMSQKCEKNLALRGFAKNLDSEFTHGPRDPEQGLFSRSPQQIAAGSRTTDDQG